MPVDRERLYDALRKADAAGDTEGAARLAAYIREQSGSAPVEPAAPEVGKGESAYRGAVQGASLRFGDEVAAGFGAAAYGLAKGVRSYLPGGVPEDAPEVGDVYTQIRDQFRAENEAAEEANPATYAAGELGGAVAGSGVNPASAVRAVAAGGRALLTRGGVAAAGRSLLTKEAAKAAGTGAAYSGAVAAGGAEELEDVPGAVLEEAPTGAVAGLAARGLFAAGSQRTASRAASAAKDAATAKSVEDFDAATAALPEQRAAVKAANKEAIAEAKAQGKSATKAKQDAAQVAEREKTLKNPLVRTGLEGKQSTLGGPRRAKARAQALVNEPSPVDPSKRLVDQADELAPDERLVFANGLRQSEGAVLGKVRDELAKAEGVSVPVGPIREQLRGAFAAELPTEVQGAALEKIDAMIGAVAKDGAVAPAALRKLIKDAEAYAKFGTPNLELALGNARGRVFQGLRGILVQAERDLVSRALPDRVPEYSEAMRRYGIYSDLELGSEAMLRRANKGQAAVRIPKAARVEPEVRQPALQPEPQAPQFPGGEAALAEGRKLLQPSPVLALGGRVVGGEIGARLGNMIPVPGAAYAGARAGEVLAERWARWVTPTTASLQGKVAKLERLKPMMEEALQKGPAEVARVHALFMQRSPDYRKAFESQE